jgi:two-component system CheB/CheR fusion protein
LNGLVAMNRKPLPAQPARTKPDFAVVGVGASAGGLEAFAELLQHLPRGTGLALVLVQHLDPAHHSHLAELLAPKTPMSVVEATEGLVVSPNFLYVAPSAADVRIEEGRLRLSPRPSSGRHLPVDSFLASLADDMKSRAVAVVLSGTAADGTQGVKAVRAAGGVTFAQDPATARHPGMPESAIATGAVDFILPLAEIAGQLAVIAGHTGPLPPTPARRAAVSPPIDDPALADLLSLVRSATTVDFTNYKRGTLQRRIGRRMAFRHLTNLEDYVQVLRRDPAEVMNLYQDLLIRVTSFFRQPAVFEALKQSVFPQIAQARNGEQVRFWVPGCATGEEAYSLAIAWAEVVGVTHQAGKKSLQVFATDINQQAIDTARLAVYPSGIAADVSPKRLERFFAPADGGYKVSERIRELCVFARQDLTRDPPFSKLDLISLRNVLIYLGPLLQRRVLPSLHFALRPGGFLLLGEAESLGGFTDLFSLLDKKAKIYTRREASPFIPPAPKPVKPHTEAVAVPSPAPPAACELSREVERVLLENYAPAGVIVDADLQIREYRGDVQPYLQIPSGRASFDIIRMARNGLSGELRAALKDAAKEGSVVRRRGVRLLRHEKVRAVGFDVLPIKAPTGETSFLILFLDMPEEAARPVRESQPAPEPPEVAASQAEALERELSEMRDYTRAVLEDKESANEELRSANEELQAANEELQSVNEELETTSEEVQSANEELRTVNEELESANEQRSKANAELEGKNARLRELNLALEGHKKELRTAWDYAQAVVDAVREPLIVLGPGYRVVSASAAFFNLFGTRAAETVDQDFFRLDGGQWDMPELREAVTAALVDNRRFQDFIAERDFVRLGHRTMLLSGGRFQRASDGLSLVLLAIDDITARARLESLGNALERIGLGMVSSFDADEILRGAVTEAAGALGCSQALLAVSDRDAWVVRFALGKEEPASGTTLTGAIARQFSALAPGQRTVVASRSKGASSFGQRSSERVHAALTVRDEVVGVISFGGCFPVGRFGEPELDFIDKLAPALSLALENARLFSIHQRVAETFQRSLLKPIAPVEGFEVGLAYVPAFEPEKVGGDFYDLFSLEGGLTAVIVGDVVGKGVQAAVLTETVRTMLRTVASMEPSPSLVLKKVNDLLRESTGRQFVTVVVAVIDTAKGTITISSAGHPPAILYGKESRLLQIPPATPLGVGDGRFHEGTFDIKPGETLVLYTDGLIEARQGNALFGEERVLKELRRVDGMDVQKMVDALVSSASQFAGGHLGDDLVIIAIRPTKLAVAS